MPEILIRNATITDIYLLLPLIQKYWSFEQIHEFKVERITTSLVLLFSKPYLGNGWLALVDTESAYFIKEFLVYLSKSIKLP